MRPQVTAGPEQFGQADVWWLLLRAPGWLLGSITEWPREKGTDYSSWLVTCRKPVCNPCGMRYHSVVSENGSAEETATPDRKVAQDIGGPLYPPAGEAQDLWWVDQLLRSVRESLSCLLKVFFSVWLKKILNLKKRYESLVNWLFCPFLLSVNPLGGYWPCVCLPGTGISAALSLQNASCMWDDNRMFF